MLLIVALQALFYNPTGPERKEEDCFGEPLYVDYPFKDSYLEPHACELQCEDGIQHYVIYSNNLATQCETLPGCNDEGEDRGVTCKWQ